MHPRDRRIKINQRHAEQKRNTIPFARAPTSKNYPGKRPQTARGSKRIPNFGGDGDDDDDDNDDDDGDTHIRVYICEHMRAHI